MCYKWRGYECTLFLKLLNMVVNLFYQVHSKGSEHAHWINNSDNCSNISDKPLRNINVVKNSEVNCIYGKNNCMVHLNNEEVVRLVTFNLCITSPSIWSYVFFKFIIQIVEDRWKYCKLDDGDVSILYQCVDSLHFKEMTMSVPVIIVLS